jgi:hypothetical protein
LVLVDCQDQPVLLEREDLGESEDLLDPLDRLVNPGLQEGVECLVLMVLLDLRDRVEIVGFLDHLDQKESLVM